MHCYPPTNCSHCNFCRTGLGRSRCTCDLDIVLIILLAIIVAALSGCVSSQSIGKAKPFAEAELNSCLTVVVDMSGSFSDSWQDRAYPLLQELMDQFFTAGAGANSRVVIAQLSGNKEVVLYEGQPSDLRRRFGSPEELNDFLQQRSDPSSSPVFHATNRAIAYVAAMPGITENTRLMTVILSDMADNEQDASLRLATGQQMLTTLEEYQQLGGGLALYFVAMDQTERWRRILAKAGFTPGTYVIENTLVANPQLPSFD